MPDLGTFVMWGVPLLALVSGIVRLVKWLKPDAPEKLVKGVGGLLTALGVMGVRVLDVLVPQYPWIGEWGPYVLWSFVAFLIYTGNFPDIVQGGMRIMSAKTKEGLE